jgi:hypothetical protein
MFFKIREDKLTKLIHNFEIKILYPFTEFFLANYVLAIFAGQVKPFFVTKNCYLVF